MDLALADHMTASATTTPETMPLDRLGTGASAVVLSVHGETALRRRLLEMGLTTGTRITVVRRAPMGDPIELGLRGYRLSLRAEQARHVTVADRA